MKYYIIAGEASGDLHASNLMKSIQEKDKNAVFRFWGGNLMQEVGGTLVKHYKDLAFMGFLEVVKNLKTILNNIDFCKKDIENFKPDILILVDYPGFNLRIATFAKKCGIPVHYYISPQIWAWKEGRIKQIKRDVDYMYVILPFEKDFYQKHQFPVQFVGHPLLDAIANTKTIPEAEFRKQYNLGNKPIIALLPGSRTQEIVKLLNVMLSVVPFFEDYQFVIAGAPSKPKEFYDKIIDHSSVKFVSNKTYDLLSIAAAAVVTSGTATLETALFKVPEVVCYKTSNISYQIGKWLIKLKFISLVNLIMDKEVVKELIQEDCNTQNLKTELSKILSDKGRQKVLNDYEALTLTLGGVGASEKLATLIVSTKLNPSK